MRRYLTFFLLLAAAAFSLRARPSGIITSPDLKDAEALVEKYLDTFNSRDLVALGALYADDGLVVPPSSLPVRGRDAIKNYWTNSTRRSLTFEILQRNVCGEAGFFVGKYKAVQTPGLFLPAGGFILAVNRIYSGRPGPVQGSFTLCLQRSENGGWRIATDMWNESVSEGFIRAGYTPAARPKP